MNIAKPQERFTSRTTEKVEIVMKFLNSSNVEWFDSLDHNKILFCVFSTGLGCGLWTVSHLFSNPHLETKLYIPATPLFAALMLSLVMLLQTFDGWKKRNFYSPQKVFLRHVEVNFREWKMWKFWIVINFSLLHINANTQKAEMNFFSFRLFVLPSAARQWYFSTFLFVQRNFISCRHECKHRMSAFTPANNREQVLNTLWI